MVLVTEDLVRYMEEAMSPNNRFLVDDPTFAIDFAPNGALHGSLQDPLLNF